MKYLIVILLLIITSCNSKTKDNVATEKVLETELIVPKTKFNLIDTVFKNLNISKKNCKLDLVALKENPTNPEETIIVIPEIVVLDSNDHSYYGFNSYTLIVDTNTGEIKHKFFETAKTNGWLSDAVILAKIKIDTSPYILSENKRAFGVHIFYHNNSQVNPHNYQTISLFVKTEQNLQKILNSYNVQETHGELNDVCHEDYIEENKVLFMSKNKTNGYFNILVNNTITKTKRRPDINNNCIETEEIKSEASTLIFNNNAYKKSEKQDLICATIDSVSLAQIKRYSNSQQSIYDYYKVENEDEVGIWSDKMFGRCCSEADLNYSELLDFKISANIENKAYPIRNLSDKTYRSAYVFKENDNVEITLKLLKNSDSHTYHTDLNVDEVLKLNDTILKPFRLSLVNGYAKSEGIFERNGSVKTLEIYLNNNYKSTILLQNTPLVQEFSLDFAFFKNDVVKLVPTSYYKGTMYYDICISEIQSSLAEITYPNFNKKFNIDDIRKQ